MPIRNPTFSYSGLKELLFSVIKPTAIIKSQIGGNSEDVEMIMMAAYHGKLYVGTYNSTDAIDSTGAKLFVFDGTSWTTINKSVMGGTTGDYGLMSMALYKDKLYIGTMNTTASLTSTGSKILVFDGSSWTAITKATMGADANDVYLYYMAVYNDGLYIGTRNLTAATDATGSKLIKYNGSAWSIITKATMGGVAADTGMKSLAVYEGSLYVGTANATAATNATAAKVIQLATTVWSVITKATMGGVAADVAMLSMAVYNGKLYVGTQNVTAAVDATASKLLVFSGNAWLTIIKSVMGGATTDTYFECMAIYNGKLYVSSYNATAAVDTTACKLFQFNQMVWATIVKSTLGGVTTDQDLYCMAVFNSKFYLGTYSTVSATDATGSKVVFFQYPIAENLNSYAPRGF